MTIADLVAKRPITSLAVLLGMVAAVAPSFAAVTGKGYWQESQTENCSSAAVCIVDFSAVPASKQVTITSVSCAIVVNGCDGPGSVAYPLAGQIATWDGSPRSAGKR